MNPEHIYQEAALWLERQRDEPMDWDSFAVWLEANPQHRGAYDELALIDDALNRNAASLLHETSNAIGSLTAAQRAVRWSAWAGLGTGAIAAGLAGLLWLSPGQPPMAVQDYQSAPSRTLAIALAGGGRVLLAPASHLVVMGSKLKLQGTAFFDIPHRHGRLLSIGTGDFQVTDVGTRFSLENDPEAVVVEVAEGALAVSSIHLAKPVPLAAGQGLVADRLKGTVRVTSVEPEQVGSWRFGKLEFNNAPLALVARQISRYSRQRVTVDPEIADQPFSGVIAFNHGEAPEKSLAQILSLQITRVDGAMRLEPRRR